jgi:F-type H+-transporting ATPase subunit delta
VTPQGAARRYAAALYDVVSKTGDPAVAARDLDAVRDLIDGSAELQQMLASPGVSADKKGAIVSAVIKAGGGVSVEVTRLVEILAGRNRLGLIANLAAAFRVRLREAQRIVPAEVITAAPLTDAQRVAVQAAIAKASGRDVTLSARVDPAIMGGVIARVGSVVFDGSVTRQLERLRQRLTEAQ